MPANLTTLAHFSVSSTMNIPRLGYGLTFGAIAAEPFAGLAWVHLDTASFTETGGVSALAGTGNKEDVGYSILGARVATYYLLQNGMALIPRASVAWQHAFRRRDADRGAFVPEHRCRVQHLGCSDCA
jgi:outer membrane autotransporter protein